MEKTKEVEGNLQEKSFDQQNWRQDNDQLEIKHLTMNLNEMML